jgi:hypothetical protein
MKVKDQGQEKYFNPHPGGYRRQKANSYQFARQSESQK